MYNHVQTTASGLGVRAVGFGADAHEFGEETGKIIRIVDAQFETDLIEFHVGAVKHLAGTAYFQNVEVVERTVTSALPEHRRQMRR